MAPLRHTQRLITILPLTSRLILGSFQITQGNPEATLVSNMKHGLATCAFRGMQIWTVVYGWVQILSLQPIPQHTLYINLQKIHLPSVVPTIFDPIAMYCAQSKASKKSTVTEEESLQRLGGRCATGARCEGGGPFGPCSSAR